MASIGQIGRNAGSRFLAALAYRDYRIMWLSTMSAGASAWALIVARGALVFSLTNSSALVGIVTFAAMSPQLIAPLLAGFLADRLDRRKLLAWTFDINIVLNLVLFALAVSGAIAVWHLVVLSFVNGLARATQMPAAQALVPNLVPKDKLLNAVALSTATMHASRLFGPLLIAPLLATVGAAWAFFLCAILYGISLTLVVQIRTASTGVIERDKDTMHNLLAGFSYVYNHPLLLSIVLLAVLHCSLTMAFESMIPVLAQAKLGVGQEGFAYIIMAVGAGALVTVVGLAGVQNERARGKLMLWLGLASGLGPVALAASTVLPSALASAVVMGAAQAGFMTLTHVIVQTIVPDAIRGRVSSIYTFHVGGMMALFNLVNGFMADMFNAPVILTVTGVTFLGVMVVSLLRAPLRSLYAEGLPSALRLQAA